MSVHPPGPPLPIDEVLHALHVALAECTRVVLHAAPGAGKSTRVPLSLLGCNWLGANRMLVLEPRRLAARAVARRMAELRGERVGDTVGYRVRGETAVGKHTSIEVVTEGVLTRMLLADATLEGYGIVVFDEFHERSMHADFGLALARQSQDVVRPDLRILVMSATIVGLNFGAVLGEHRTVATQSRVHPVTIRYRTRAQSLGIESAVAAAVSTALVDDAGSVLAFLPGGAEIRRCAEILERALPPDTDVMPLYGDLTPALQDAAIRPVRSGRRKVVLATSIAETSLTIVGVRIVIDCGLSRVAKFSARTGMSRLETTRVSRASATQRAGRAGRTEPGVCYRLWPESDDLALAERAAPEILDADLAPLALDLAAAGVVDIHDLRWIDAPPPDSLQYARRLLFQLRMLDDKWRITPHGAAASALGLHPRLAHMLLLAREEGLGATACLVAALLEERDLLRGSPDRDPDLRLRYAFVLRTDAAPEARRVRARAARLCALLGIANGVFTEDADVGTVVALAYPDRVGRQRASGGRFLLRNGTGAMLAREGALSPEGFLAVAELDGRSPNARIFLAAPIAEEVLVRLFAQDIQTREVVEWDQQAGMVRVLTQTHLGAIVLRERGAHGRDFDRIAAVLLEAIRCEQGIVLPWSDRAVQLRQRVAFLRARNAAWPDWGDESLMASLELWLLPHLIGLHRRDQVQQLPLHDLLLDSLPWALRRDLDRLAPSHVIVPSGSRIPIDYSYSGAPRFSVRLQEVFGLEHSPTVADGAVPLAIELLSPAHRPVQVTRDLAGFWRTSYFDVRKDLRGRYPRHEWPEDPLNAAPTRRAKPRG